MDSIGVGGPTQTLPVALTAAVAAGSVPAAGAVVCGGCAGGGVWVADADVRGLGDEELTARLGVIGRAESSLAAMKAAALSEIARRHDTAAAEHAARAQLAASGRSARSDVKLGLALDSLDVTREGLASGVIPGAHAKLIARAAGEGPIDEKHLASVAQQQGYDQFRRTVQRHQADQAADDGKSLLERQRENRSGRVFTSSETGMTVLNAQFDPVIGVQIAAVVAAAERDLYRDEDPDNRPSHHQRTADAIAKLLLEPSAAGRRRGGTTLLIVADYDAVGQGLANARLADGSPVPISELAQLACDAQILPAIFDRATGDLCMGRMCRFATDAQRAALALRDQGCIGCAKSPIYCEAHHIVPWEIGGRTDLANLVLVCNRCHHHIHDDGWQVHRRHATGNYELRPPTRSPPEPTTARTDARGAAPASKR
ncbi:HNH endonuclease signature motif containing protein [Candidatus Poriferisodalis sp.]|uniref:HNH endonuclease signature motif containing protein n=1 Tax=Candidatus Poriferisodalis sp. TaxID=3101277 RepID=UPI003B5BF78B